MCLWGNRLDLSFFARDTKVVAKELLGKWLVYEHEEGITAGRIVETEAYMGVNDPACHSARGCTNRNRVMFGEAGNVYIYTIYGMYECLNVTTEEPSKPEAVLFRAIEPVVGIELMQKRRGKEKLKDLCSGPAKLVIAFDIPKAYNGNSFLTGSLGIYDALEKKDSAIVTTTRIGISQGAELPLRFYLKDNPYISKK